MSGGGDYGQDGSISGINVTPLVDVMLVLLVIFMVTAPIIQQSVVNVDLPQAGAAEPVAEELAVVISVTADGSVYLNDEALGADEIAARVLALIKERPERTIYIRGDDNSSYGAVVDVVASLKDAGVARLGLLTRPESGEGG